MNGVTTSTRKTGACCDRRTRAASAGSADAALAGADVFLGLSGPGAVSANAIRTMAPDAIVFALANPTPEVLPEEIEGDVAVVATGPLRLSEPDQQRARLPRSLPRRARRARLDDQQGDGARRGTRDRGGRWNETHLAADYVIPSVFNKDVAPAVARAVSAAAVRTGVARKEGRPSERIESDDAGRDHGHAVYAAERRREIARAAARIRVAGR